MISQWRLRAEFARRIDPAPYDMDRLAGAMDRPVHDPFELYGAQQAASLLALRLEPAHPERTS